jgi:molybdopterin converting factor small subunit
MLVSVERLGILTQMPRRFTSESVGLTIRQFIVQLSEQYGSEVGELMMDGEMLREGILVMLNGRSIASQNGLETKLNDGDDVLLTILAVGG